MLREFTAPPGVRVVRVLARDHYTERLLVHVDDEDGSTPAELVRACDAAGSVGVRRAISALDRLQTAGIVGPIDVLDDGGTPALLLPHQRGATLSDLLASRLQWQAGEAVAVLAPLVEVLDGMHDAGVAHGGLTAGRVTMLLDGVWIAGFDSAELFPARAPEVVRESVLGVTRDREALRSLAVDILSRVGGSRATAAHELGMRLQTASGARIAEQLGVGLAELAAAIPVVMHDPDPRDEGMPHAPAGAVATREELPSNVRARILARAAQLVASLREVLAGMPSGRRRIVVGGGAAVAVAGLLLAVIPPGDRDEVPSTQEESGSHADPASPPAPEGTPEGDPMGEPGRLDDPAEAAIALVEQREECFRQLSVLCLDGVDQIGSEALSVDRSAMLRLQDGGEDVSPKVDPVAARVVERLGDSALVEIGPETAPASLLMMRSEAGWRIRDWIAVG